MTKEKEDNSDFEINFYESLLQKKPDFYEALSALADLYTKKGLNDKALAIDLQLEKMRPQDPFVLYNIACDYSLLQDINRSLYYLQEAFRCGYDDVHYIEEDSDLENLRSDERFQQFFLNIKQKNQIDG